MTMLIVEYLCENHVVAYTKGGIRGKAEVHFLEEVE